MTEDAASLPAPADNIILPGHTEETASFASGKKDIVNDPEGIFIFKESIPGKLFILVLCWFATERSEFMNTI
jgi:hypothetical protein